MKAGLKISLFLFLAGIIPAAAQNASDIVISEAMAENVNSVTDRYGRHTGWIELYNTSQGTVNYAGCFLTDDRALLRKYMIPKGDLATRLGPRQAVLFFCGGNGDEGTFHTNFTLCPGATVYLVSNDGRTVIDSLSVPAGLGADRSVQKVPVDAKGLVFEVSETGTPTPGAPASAGSSESGSQRMQRTDPHGWTLTLTSVAVVFLALLILAVLFTFTGKGFSRRKEPAPAAGGETECDDGEGIAAAIALALELSTREEVHDRESYVITFPRSVGLPYGRGGSRRLPKKRNT